MSRAQAILRHVVAHPESSLAAIVAAVVADLHSLDKPAQAAVAKRVAAQLDKLKKKGRVVRIDGGWRNSRWSATATALVPADVSAAQRRAWETRHAKRDAAGIARQDSPAAHRGAAASPPVREVPRALPTPPPPAADSPLRASVVSFSAPRQRGGDLTREELDAHLAAFYARGGQVQQLTPGECARPLKCAAEAHARGETPAGTQRRRVAVPAFRSTR